MRNAFTVLPASAAKRFDPNVTVIPGATELGGNVTTPPARPASSSEAQDHQKRAVPADDGATDTLTIYLRQISSVRLLTADEEQKLARRVQQGDETARERMILANLKLVVRIATNYQGHGLSLLDLISEGNIGLMTAVDRFDPDRGARLSTYAAIWIKQTIRRAIGNHGRTIRLPVHVVETIIRLRQVASQLEGKLGREPDDDELGKELGLRPHRVRHLRAAAAPVASLDAPLDDEEDAECLGTIVADERSCWTPAQDAERQARLDELGVVLDSLEPRERLVLRNRFGLNGGGEYTLDAIGQKLGLTRERIRQIEKTALKKLRKRLSERDALTPLLAGKQPRSSHEQ